MWGTHWDSPAIYWEHQLIDWLNLHHYNQELLAGWNSLCLEGDTTPPTQVLIYNNATGRAYVTNLYKSEWMYVRQSALRDIPKDM